jgi:cytochrome c553
VSGAGRSLGAAVLLICLAAGVGHSAANFPPPEWAYPQTPRPFTPDPDDGKPKRLAGSTRAYTYQQIEDSFAPADWYPGEHPRMPAIPVATGRKPDLRACSWCHLPNGLGHPQSGSLAGLSAEYLTQQLADFKSGARHASVGNSIMATIARAMTAEETKAAIDYFSQLPRTPWITIIEGEMVPKTRIIEGGLRVPLEPQEMEPLGQRVIEVPKFPVRSRAYDAHAPFVAYVPMGSIRRGRALVSSGGAVMRGTTVVVPGKVPPCGECHGPSLRGLPHAPDTNIAVPALSGRSPTYIVRQLYDIASGARSGQTTELMKPIAAQLTLQEMIDIAAYVGSKAP